jgi:rhodanese-related sulfurtransferase
MTAEFLGSGFVMINEIDLPSLKSRIDSGEPITFVEAMSRLHYEYFHIQGAVNIPPGAVSKLAPRLLPNKQSMVVVYCASSTCHSSVVTATELANLGYTNVWVYGQGKKEWIRAGLPTEGRARKVW